MGGSRSETSMRCKILRRMATSGRITEKEWISDDSLPSLILETDAADSDSDVSVDRCHVAKRVGFANVQVREYSVTIGDHPCCTMGCPLSLDWDYAAESVTPLDRYEAQRPQRRSRHDLRTTAAQRMQILSEDGGVSDGELRRATRKLHRARTCGARLSERMSESFFRKEQEALTPPPNQSC